MIQNGGKNEKTTVIKRGRKTKLLLELQRGNGVQRGRRISM